MLPIIKPTRKSGIEKFTFNGVLHPDTDISDFWKWYCSDLMINSTRGGLAEFIVALSLGQKNKIRTAWEPWDLTYNGIKIEVKSSAYIQSWYQKKYSNIIFSIRKARAWNEQTNELSSELKRHSDIYVFALLKHKDQSTIDPLNLNQWIFYVLPTKVLNENVGDAKTIGLKKLMELGTIECSFSDLKNTIKAKSN